MKYLKSFFPFMLICFLACKGRNVKTDKGTAVVNAKQLIKIIADSSFSEFMNLVARLKYPLLDSSYKSADSLLIYSAEEDAEFGDYLSAHLTDNRHVKFLLFGTFDPDLFEDIRSQLLNLGFKSSWDDKMERFMNEAVYIILFKNEEGNAKSYTISLVRKNQYPW